jgi:hypothetical protein
MRKPKNKRTAEITAKKEAKKLDWKKDIESRERAIRIMNENKGHNLDFSTGQGDMVRVYVINGKEYHAPECFQDEEFMSLVENDAKVESKLVKREAKPLGRSIFDAIQTEDESGILTVGNDTIIAGRPSYFG